MTTTVQSLLVARRLLLLQQQRCNPLMAAITRRAEVGRRLISTPTHFLAMAEKTIALPGLGDSITEGTIVEWTAAVGQAVQEGDVVAMVETDKVTVDIKAEMDGVITEHFSAVDDTIEVGADLYKIDTEGTATVTASSDNGSTDAAPAAEASAEPVVAAAAPSATTSTTRTPSIQFRGKEGWAKLRAQSTAPTIVHFPPMYGRPLFTQDEMDALVSGGADMAPQVKRHSSGAMFGY